MNIATIDLSSEFEFKASRSGGKGGQNVNKVSSKVELSFDVVNSQLLSEDQKQVIMEKLRHRITDEGVLKIVVQADRSQLANKKAAVAKLYELLVKAFAPRKKRIATKPSKAVKEKRLKEKKIASQRKANRRKPPGD